MKLLSSLRKRDEISQELIPWMILHHEAKSILQRVRSDWSNLLGEKDRSEDDYHAYLADHAGLFLAGGSGELVVISKLRLGGDLVTDFVIGKDRRSLGFEYEFIELETPHKGPYKQDGTPSARLSKAVQQIQNWQLWSNANRAEAKRLLPSREFVHFNAPSFTWSIVIGRRDNSNRWLHLRNYYSRELGIEVRSFDSLTDRLMERRFPGSSTIPSAEMDEVPPKLRNQLVNPFFEAYPDRSWRRLTRHPQFSYIHMIAKNAKLLLGHREYNNDLLHEFMSIWEGLPHHRRSMYIDLVKEEDMLFRSGIERNAPHKKAERNP